MVDDALTRRQVLGYGTALGAGVAAASVVTAGPAGADEDPGPAGPQGPEMLPSVSLRQARQVIAAAERRAREIGVPMFIVVVDVCGDTKAVHRMDGNALASPTLAPLKAVTANAFRTATDVLATNVASDPTRIASFTTAGFSLLGGGVPIVVGGAVIGAVGVGGGSPE